MANRRANGEAQFRLRSDGRWEGRLRYIDREGEGRRVSAYGASRALAKAALEKKAERIRKGLAVVDSKAPLCEAARKWRTTTLIASGRRQSTKDLYAARCRLHIESGLLADIPLSRLMASDIEEWIVEARKHGVSPSSLRTDFTVLRAVLDMAVRDGLVAKNVAECVERPGVPRTEALHLTPAQVGALLDKVATSRHALPILLAAVTGMRRGEVLGLRWCDVDLDARTIRVTGTLAGSGTSLRRESSPKTASSRRTLPIGDDLVDLLRKQHVEQSVQRSRALNMWDEAGYVFTTEFGRPTDPRRMLSTVKQAAVELGLPNATSLHTLRHSAATALLASGTHLKLVSTILGHSNSSVTANVYGHASDESQRAALDALHAQVAGTRSLSAVPDINREGR